MATGIFVDFQTRSILQSASASADRKPQSTLRAARLQSLAAQFNSPLQGSELDRSVASLLKELDENECIDEAEELLEWEALSRSVVAVYTEAMRLMLQEAIQADDEAEWWQRVEQIGGGTAWYLLQTLPHRFARLGHSVLSTIRRHDREISFSTFSVKNLDQMFPPHMLSHLFKRSFYPQLHHPYDFFRTNPLDLARRECHAKRALLTKVRDERAKVLGALANLRSLVEHCIGSTSDLESKKTNLATVIELMERSFHTDPSVPPVFSPTIPARQPSPRLQIKGQSLSTTSRIILPRLQTLLSAAMPAFSEINEATIAPLRRPSRLTRLWPRIVFIPPIAFIILKVAFRSREKLLLALHDAKETVLGFWAGWVVEPVSGIIKTIRSGGDDSARVISKEGLHSDMDSLERMVVQLAQEKLNYTPAQLRDLSEKVHQGDLTPVLKLYEQDIKSPLSAVMRGNLIRSLLIQIQKTKVDVDLALSGIDKLLKSQELTFAFVGVAPSLAVLYISAGWVKAIWKGQRGRKRLGGLLQRERTLVAVRRIERLLIGSTAASDGVHKQEQEESLSPLTKGLLLVSIAHLREYGVKYLPPRSRLQLGFLEDVEDLEDPEDKLGRLERLQIVSRMWRSWSSILGWSSDAVGRTVINRQPY